MDSSTLALSDTVLTKTLTVETESDVTDVSSTATPNVLIVDISSSDAAVSPSSLT